MTAPLKWFRPQDAALSMWTLMILTLGVLLGAFFQGFCR